MHLHASSHGMQAAPRRFSALSVLLWASAGLRLALVVWGEVQDRLMQVKYTDIDYVVFTDAARFVMQGRSPYERATYRYSPLLAYLLTPNVWLHGAWGKLLFSAADIVAALLIVRIARRSRAPELACLIAASAWLLNPFTLTISTRGSADALTVALLLSVLDALQRGRVDAAAVAYGVVVHLRVYPIIFAPALEALEPEQQQRTQQADGAAVTAAAPAAPAAAPAATPTAAPAAAAASSRLVSAPSLWGQPLLPAARAVLLQTVGLAGRSRSHQIPPAMRDVSGALHSGPDRVLKAMTESFDKLYGGETKLSDETLNQLENDVAAFELTRATEVDEAHGRPPDLAETEACVRALCSAAAPGGDQLDAMLLRCPPAIAWLHRVIIAARFAADRGQMITIVSAYSPTEAASDEEAGDFYLRVAALADKANDKRDLLIVADRVLKAMTESFDKLYGGETKLSDETLNQLENDVAAFELTRATEVDEAHGRPPDLAETEACGAYLGALSGGVFLLLGALFYARYGAPFASEAFLHHVGRRDPRHNFAPHFYPVYLTAFSGGGGGGGGGAAGQIGVGPNQAGLLDLMVRSVVARVPTPRGAPPPAPPAAAAPAPSPDALLVPTGGLDVGAPSSLLQLALQAVLAAALHWDPPGCLLLQTLAFVALNKTLAFVALNKV
ncbi:hypothetical protein FOA52_010662 [Chlamydomonas sp. UWO 241]|nr:hypothetical protein FOA52_010662 [Chlamydomonas sp. UWO 241]